MGTRTATRQISPGNPNLKTQEETERPVREKIIYIVLSPQEWRKKRNTHESTHEWSNQPVKNKRYYHTRSTLTHWHNTHRHTHTRTHNTHTHTHTHTHSPQRTYSHLHTHQREHKLIRWTSTRARPGRLRTHLHVRQSLIRVGHHCGKRTRTRNFIPGPSQNLPSRSPDQPTQWKTGARSTSYSGRVIPTSLGAYD